MLLANICAGFLVGIVVGITGVGGGALMTPILVMVFGYSPQAAVGTDLIFAATTKTAGWAVHGYRGTVDWQVFRRLCYGSLPAALVTVILLYFSKSPVGKDSIIITMVGLAIVITSIGLILKPLIYRMGEKWRLGDPTVFKKWQPAGTVLAGAILGVLVSLTSIGAGALGATMLIYLYPLRMKPATLVGTDIAHAIPLALVAGLGHLTIGNVDFLLLRNLLIGSIPGIILGSLVATKVPDRLVRYALSVMLLLVGIRMFMH